MLDDAMTAAEENVIVTTRNVVVLDDREMKLFCSIRRSCMTCIDPDRRMNTDKAHRTHSTHRRSHIERRARNV